MQRIGRGTVESGEPPRVADRKKGFVMVVGPSWEGHLRLSLVTCPVALYAATSGADIVRFNLIDPETNNRIRRALKTAKKKPACRRAA